jgi:hypothetical protein
MSDQSEALVMTELGFDVAIIERMESEGRWPDLTRLEARRSDALRAAAWMLAHDVPHREICSALSLSPCTVQAIAAHPVHGLPVVTLKARLTGQMKLAFRLGIEGKVQDAKDGKLSMFDLKLLWEMIQISEGGVTQRTEHVESQEATELRVWLEQTRQAMRDVSPGPGMVSEAETLPAVGGPILALGDAAAAAVRLTNKDKVTDYQSPTK